jgi:phospho-N-acetylmuramoyl-pentapeptide-transferase
MGGLVIMTAVVLAYFGSHLITFTAPSASALLVLFLFTGLGVVGFLDDYIKIRKQRSLGLRSKAKIAGQSIVAILFALASLQFPDERGITPASPAISFLRDRMAPIAPDPGDHLGHAADRGRQQWCQSH